MKITKDSVVELEYTLTNDKGDVLDTSKGAGPLTYLHGHQNIIPGLEKHLEGKEAGETLQTVVQPEEGYGHRDENLINEVPRAEFGNLPNIEVGMQLQGQTAQGVQLFTVLEVSDDKVKLDANHPLAGIVLNFDVSVKTVRAGTAEEVSHGHVHGPGSHVH